jgi:hypothetical protein
MDIKNPREDCFGSKVVPLVNAQSTKLSGQLPSNSEKVVVNQAQAPELKPSNLRNTRPMTCPLYYGVASNALQKCHLNSSLVNSQF